METRDYMDEYSNDQAYCEDEPDEWEDDSDDGPFDPTRAGGLFEPLDDVA